ncbi:uncharacterized protein LOC144928773 [Branchiostoma floridae x Branchiostoma belcheri]
MKNLPLLFITTLAVLKSNAALELCSSDQDCIDVHGYGSCCAPRVNFFSPVPQCKPATEGGKVCFLESNNMPYPMKRPSPFFLCPCAGGLVCRRVGHPVLGRCGPEPAK